MVQNFLRKFKVNKCKKIWLLVYKMKIMQLVVYVSPEGVIIAKCKFAPIQSSFLNVNITLCYFRFLYLHFCGLSVVDLSSTLIFCWEI